MTICPHKRKRSTVIFLEPNHEQTHPVAVITIQCHECGQPFEFVGYTDSPEMVISADRLALRVMIIEARKGRVQRASSTVLRAEWHTRLRAAGHEPKLDENGDIDLFAFHAFDGDGIEHDGPSCIKCGEQWCAWCNHPVEPCAPAGITE